MSDEIAKNLANEISNQDDTPVSVSAMILSDRIGYPKRVVSEKEESHDGEMKDFDEAYDFASNIFDTSDISIEKDEQYIWFIDNSS
jgi:hypothetical protein